MRAMPDLKDIIAIKFCDKNGKQGACITWGKIFTEQELIEIIKDQCLQQEFENVVSIAYCYSLQEVSKYPYFYERWMHFVQQDISYQHAYKKWVQRKREAILHGQDIKFMACRN